MEYPKGGMPADRLKVHTLGLPGGALDADLFEWSEIEDAHAVVAFLEDRGQYEDFLKMGYALGLKIPVWAYVTEPFGPLSPLIDRIDVAHQWEAVADDVAAQLPLWLEMRKRLKWGREAVQSWWKGADKRLPRAFHKGHVYLLRAGDYFKIGKAFVIDQRLTQLAIQLPEKPVVEHVIRADAQDGAERFFHAIFQRERANGEWFRLNDAQVAWFKGWGDWKIGEWL